jgi:hypothetical protein
MSTIFSFIQVVINVFFVFAEYYEFVISMIITVIVMSVYFILDKNT